MELWQIFQIKAANSDSVIQNLHSKNLQLETIKVAIPDFAIFSH
jgi:hypothetical protein